MQGMYCFYVTCSQLQVLCEADKVQKKMHSMLYTEGWHEALYFHRTLEEGGHTISWGDVMRSQIQSVIWQDCIQYKAGGWEVQMIR